MVTLHQRFSTRGFLPRLVPALRLAKAHPHCGASFAHSYIQFTLSTVRVAEEVGDTMGVWSDLESEVSDHPSSRLPVLARVWTVVGGRLRPRLCPIPLEAVHFKSVQLLWDPLTLLTAYPRSRDYSRAELP